MSRRAATFFLTLLVFLLLALTAWMNWALQRIENSRKTESGSSPAMRNSGHGQP